MAIRDRRFGDEPQQPIAHRFQPRCNRRNAVAQRFERRVRRGRDGEAARGEREERVADGAPFLVVAVKERITRAGADGGELPRQIRDALNPRVHSLSADRRMDVRGVACEECTSAPIAFGFAFVDVESRRPGRLAGDDSGADAPRERRLEIAERRRRTIGALVFMEHDDQAPYPLREPSHEEDVAAVQVDAQLVTRDQTPRQLEIAEEKREPDRVAAKVDAECAAHGAVRAVGADDPPRANPFEGTVPAANRGIDPVIVVVETNELDAALDPAAERNEMVAQVRARRSGR